MSNTDEFANAVEAGSGGKTWKPENVGDVLIGTYKAFKSNVGQNNSNVFVIQEDGEEETTNVWGSTVLDGRFEEVPIGSRVRIEYLGKEAGKNARSEYKNFSVKYIRNDEAAKVEQAIGDKPEDVS